MSSGLHRLGLFYYNFTAILCLSFKNGTYKISSFQAIVNVLKAPLHLASIILIAAYPSSFDIVFRETIVSLDKFSNFSKFSLGFAVFIMQSQVILLGIFQVSRKREILNFIIKVSETTLDEKYSRKFKDACLKRTIKSNFMLLVVLLVQYFGSVESDLLSLAVILYFSYPLIVMYSFVVFVISFESFLTVLLKQFKKDLRRSSSSLNDEVLLKLSKQYQGIHNLVGEFEKSFGGQLTTITVFHLFGVVFNVNRLFNIFRSRLLIVSYVYRSLTALNAF